MKPKNMGKKVENEREIEVYWDRNIENMSDEEILEWISKLPIEEEVKKILRLRFGLEQEENIVDTNSEGV
jgi:hypothetical protein